MKHYASVVGNQGEKHAYASLALSFSIHWTTFDYVKILDSLKILFLFLFFIFMFLIHGKTPDMIARMRFGPI